VVLGVAKMENVKDDLVGFALVLFVFIENLFLFSPKRHYL